MTYNVIQATELIFVHRGSTINVRNNPVASETAVTQLAKNDKLFLNYSGFDGTTYTQIKEHDNASNLDFVYCNVFTKDGFFRNVWVAVENTVTGTKYLSTQPYYEYVREQINTAISKGTYFTHSTDDFGNPYYPTNFIGDTTDENPLIRVEKDTPVYNYKGEFVGTLHGHVNTTKPIVVVSGSVSYFDAGATLKEFLYVKYAGLFSTVEADTIADYFTGDPVVLNSPLYVKTDSISKTIYVNGNMA